MRTPSVPSSIKPVTALMLVAAVAAGAYVRAMWNGYALDDPAILANPVLHAAHRLPDVLASAWWWQGGYLYRPLTLFTLAIDQLAGNGAAWLPHAINIVLHALVAVGVTRLYQRFLPPRAALAAGVLFALLPAHVEAVSTVVGRAELLSALAMAALMLLVTTDAALTNRTRVVAAILSGAALASKEVGAVAPLLVLATAWAWPAQRRAALQWTGAALAGTALLLMARLMVLGTLLGDLPHRAFGAVSASGRMVLALAMLPRAAAMLLLPVAPVLEYAPTLASIRHPNPLLVTGGALLVVAGAMSVVWHWYRPTAATLGLCVATATLAPASNLLFASGVVLTGRTMYAPSIGAGLLVGWVLALGWTTRARVMLPYAVALVAAWELSVTWREVPVWRSTESVMRTIADRQPDSYRIAAYRANIAAGEGRDAEALAQYRIAIQRFPMDWTLLSQAGLFALGMHDSSSALLWLRGAADGTPNATRARDTLIRMMLARGDTAAATQLLVDGLRAFPEERRWQKLLSEMRR